MSFQSRPNLEVPAVPVRNVKATMEGARRVGIPAEALLADTGLCEEHIRVPAARISYRVWLKIRRNLVSHPLPGDYGFPRGPFSIASYGMLGYAMMSCATLEQAIRI